MKVRVASAGTGKTTSLVLRYLELISGGTPLRRIAGVTFTRAAADELRQRVEEGVLALLQRGHYHEFCLEVEQQAAFVEAKRELSGATLTTIHGFMIECLRLVAPMLSLDPNFTVLGEYEAQALYEEELNSLLYLASDPQHGLHNSIQTLHQPLALMQSLFGKRSLSERYYADSHPANRALETLWNASYKRYDIRLGSSLLPPSEIERRALRLSGSEVALRRLASRYHIILVDEYQDVNPLQGRFFGKLEGAGIATEVVGDPKQSIYGFRNADVEMFRQALKTGERLAPLTQTRRHAQVISRFLNHLTSSLAERNMGFAQDEAPAVESAGEQQHKPGRVEIHWVKGEKEPIANLRRFEASVLAERLKAIHQQGHDLGEMAILARSYAGLETVESALIAARLPYVLLQGRGYYERSEIRDLYHALRVGIQPQGLSLAAFLRSPYASLPLNDIHNVLQSDAPLNLLQAHHPDIYQRIQTIRNVIRDTPLNTLKFLIRSPLIQGKRYVDYLDSRARENVDALLFTVAAQPPGDLELLLDRLDRLSQQTDAGDVPQSGAGIKLLTVHKAKGLEWPLVAVFDLGRSSPPISDPVLLNPYTNHISHKDSDSYEDTKAIIQARSEAESFRLFYVAASRARDMLILSGSSKDGQAQGWIAALEAMNLGPGSKAYQRDDFILQTHPYQSTAAEVLRPLERPSLAPASYIDQVYPHYPYPPVTSPSRYKQAVHEPLPISDPDEAEQLPGRATSVGTLVHYAISQNWTPDNPVHLENLRAQEVMFPFTTEEQNDILNEVTMLLRNYESLLGDGLAELATRSEDYPELPMALPIGSTIWQGIIDRLYRVGEQWFLEDYKTDQEVNPEQYHFQLGIYLRAIHEVRGIKPVVQLVYLRAKEIIRLEPSLLETALKVAL